MKILVFTPVWKRPEITEAFCLGVLRLKKNFDLDVLCVLSDEDVTHGHKLNHELLDRYGIDYVTYKNKLGAKKNFGLNEAMKRDFDYLLEMNSDDIIANELIETYMELMEKGESFIGVGNFVFYNSETGDAKETNIQKTNTVFGIGRAYSKEALDRASKCLKVKVLQTHATDDDYFKEGECRWILDEEVTDKMQIIDGPMHRLWKDDADYGMDNESERRFRRVNIFPKVVTTDEPLAMDIKSNVNIWRFDQMWGKGVDSNKILSKISETEKEYLNGLRVK